MEKKSNISHLERIDPLSEAVQLLLIDTLYSKQQQKTLLIGSLTVVALALFCWMFSREAWLLGFAVVSFIFNAGRFWHGARFKRDGTLARSLVGVRQYAIGAGLNAIAWGVASTLAILHSNAREQIAIIGGMFGYAAVSAVRNNAVLKVVLVQVFPPIAMTAIACFATRQPFYMIYSLFLLLNLAILVEIAHSLGGMTRELLTAKERAADALGALAQANELLEMQTLTDALTGAANRRGFDLFLERECVRMERDPQPLSLLMLDIDHFKALNDTLGHQVGDECLRALAECLRQTVRLQIDVVARYGGEEFAIILPKTNREGALKVADRIRSAVRTLGFPHPSSSFRVITVSIGCASVHEGDRADPAALVKRADEAMYRAKNAGRNQVA